MGSGVMTTFDASTYYVKPYSRRMYEMYGLTNGRSGCPRQVVGKRCRAFTMGDCLCRYGSNILDHTRLWRLGPETIFTSEPYNLDVWRLQDFKNDCEELGISAYVLPGLWYEGTTLVWLERTKLAAQHDIAQKGSVGECNRNV